MQEQNAFPGLVTRLLAARVGDVYLGLPEARDRLRFGKATRVFDTGNPITAPDPERRPQALKRFGLTEGDGKPVLLVTGGSQGAIAINDAVAALIESGALEGTVVLWATGRGSYARYAKYHRPPAVQVFDFLDPMADAYAVADLVLSRAGMMTGAELCAWGLPSLLIPLPTAAEDHQRYNAEALVSAGASAMIVQAELSVERLRSTLLPLLTDRGALDRMAAAARARGKPDAADQIVSHLLELF
jgi:UDP-N-acetylglucosamine--N-acetylmuramyl-(pentapeptide) pyrophosphoryl-undecaprenol N-acetylglucosamine transferase